MKIFVDTAKLNEIKQSISLGVVDGVTTNPSLIRQAVELERTMGRKTSLDLYIRRICRAAGRGRPVSLEVLSRRASEMIREAQILHKRFNPVAGNVVVKIPVNTCAGGEVDDFEGLEAIRKLGEKKIPTNATLVMTPEQALLAGKAGATFVSPFAGRIDDLIRERLGIAFKKDDYFDFALTRKIFELKLGEYVKSSASGDISSLYQDERVKTVAEGGRDNGIISGVDCVGKIVSIFKKYGIKTKVIAASIRNARQVREVAETGCEICTCPFEVIREMVKHAKTEEGVTNFCADAAEANYDELFV